jgi:hypothetical protein
MKIRINFLKVVIGLAYLFFLLIFASTTYSIEGMNDEERKIREEQDRVVAACQPPQPGEVSWCGDIDLKPCPSR